MFGPHLYDPSYWFTVAPGPVTTKGVILFLIIFGACILGVIILNIYRHLKKKAWDKAQKRLVEKINNMLLTMGLVGFAWLLFAYEGISLLSARFWLLFWVIGFIVWLYVVIHYATVTMSTIRIENKRKQQMSKYL